MSHLLFHVRGLYHKNFLRDRGLLNESLMDGGDGYLSK